MCNECFRVPQLAITEYSICISEIEKQSNIKSAGQKHLFFSLLLLLHLAMCAYVKGEEGGGVRANMEVTPFVLTI